jgi:hypothetical protein
MNAAELRLLTINVSTLKTVLCNASMDIPYTSREIDINVGGNELNR